MIHLLSVNTSTGKKRIAICYAERKASPDLYLRQPGQHYTKKQVQGFLRSEKVQRAISSNDYEALSKSVKKYINDNHLVVHEVNTTDTQVIPFDVNNRYNHDGGVSDTKKAEKAVSKCAK